MCTVLRYFIHDKSKVKSPYAEMLLIRRLYALLWYVVLFYSYIGFLDVKEISPKSQLFHRKQCSVELVVSYHQIFI